MHGLVCGLARGEKGVHSHEEHVGGVGRQNAAGDPQDHRLRAVRAGD